MIELSNFKNSDKFWSIILLLIIILLFIIIPNGMLIILGLIVLIYLALSFICFDYNKPSVIGNHLFKKYNLMYILINNLKKFNNWLNSL